MRGINFIAVCISVALGGCAPTGPSFSGESVASKRLRDDAMQIVGPFSLGRTSSKKIDSVKTTVLGVEGELKGNSNGIVTEGVTMERWVASACGQDIPFVVTFTPDGQGGSFIDVKAQQ